jgi:uncharacterized protein (DUF2062 family)
MEKLIVCSIIIQFIVERVKPLIPSKAHKNVLPLLDMAIGTSIAFVTQSNLFEAIGIEVISNPLAMILTGISYSGGSIMFYELIQLVTEKRPSKNNIIINSNEFEKEKTKNNQEG